MEPGLPLQGTSNGGEPSETALRGVVASASEVVESTAEASTYQVTPSLTTTLMILETFAPMSLQGGWSGVATRKVAPLPAEGLINYTFFSFSVSLLP